MFLRSEENGSSLPGGSGNHPLLVPCLIGLGKFSHLIDLDFMGDLMNCLRKLACGSSNSDGSCNKLLTVSERLRCCIVAFKVMRNNLEALNVDLQEFFIQLYNLSIEYRPGRLVSDIQSPKPLLSEHECYIIHCAEMFPSCLALNDSVI